MNNFRRHWLLRQIGSALLLGTLAVRALLPLGYMPGNLLDGEIAQLCPVASAATYSLLSAGSPHHHQHGAPGDAVYSIDSACPIGSTLFSDALPATYPSNAIVPHATEYRQVHVPQSFSARPQPVYPARAPPYS